jgi:hypothetical protein
VSALLERGADTREGVVERGAHRADGGKNHDRDAAGDQRIFDRGRTRFIPPERKKPGHVALRATVYPTEPIRAQVKDSLPTSFKRPRGSLTPD